MAAAFTEKKISDTVVEFKAVAPSAVFQLRCQIILFLSVSIIFYFAISDLMLRAAVTIFAFLLFASLTNAIVEESVLVIRDFGVQLQVKSLFGGEQTKFLDKDKITRVVIHEAIRGSSIRFHLAFQLRGEHKLSLSFQEVYPGLDALQRIYGVCALMAESSVSTGKK